MKQLISSYFTSDVDASARLSLCKKCPHFTTLSTCTQCHCIMPLKVKLKHSFCPIQQWGQIEDVGEQELVSAEYAEEVNKEFI